MTLTIETDLAAALDELFYWHDQCMTRNNVSGPDSASFRSAWRELNIRVVRASRLASLTQGGNG
jgi:hypothetical protein